MRKIHWNWGKTPCNNRFGELSDTPRHLSPDHETLPDLSSICRRIAPWATASPKTGLTSSGWGMCSDVFLEAPTVGCRGVWSKGKMAVGDLFSPLPCPARRDRTASFELQRFLSQHPTKIRSHILDSYGSSHKWGYPTMHGL